MTWNYWTRKICPKSYNSDYLRQWCKPWDRAVWEAMRSLCPCSDVVELLENQARKWTFSRWVPPWPVYVYILITSQDCSPRANKGQSNILHKSCRPLTHPDSSLRKCHLFFHWMILCSLQNKPCDLSLSLLKQTKTAALHYPTTREMLAAGQHSGPANPGSEMSWDGACGIFPAPGAQLSTDSSWIKEFGEGLSTIQSMLLQIPSSH